jgi:hypothetical protein
VATMVGCCEDYVVFTYCGNCWNILL